MAKFFDINSAPAKKDSAEESKEKVEVVEKTESPARLDTELREADSAEEKETKPETEEKPEPEVKEEEKPKTSVPVTTESPSESKPEPKKEVEDEIMAQAPHIPRATEDQAPKHTEVSKSSTPAASWNAAVPNTSSRKQKIITAILSIILIILLALLVSQAVIYFTQSKNQTETPTLTSSPSPSPTTTVSPSASPDASPSPSPSPSTSPSPTSTTLTKDTATVRILNGGGVTGAGSKAQTTLKGAGYNVTSVANAKSYTYQTTLVLYKDSNGKDLADAIAAALKGYSVTTKLDAATVGSASDLLVIVGKK